MYGFKEVIRRGPNWDSGSGAQIQWWMLDKFGSKRLVRLAELLNGSCQGKSAKRGSGAGIVDKTGRYYPEYRSSAKHLYDILCETKTSYKNMLIYSLWDPRINGSTIGQTAKLIMYWMRENNCANPGLGFELHVLKTRKHPYGFFGPGGIVWRHKMDRHDNDVLDLVAEWSNKKWKQFIESENCRRIK